MDNKFIVKVEVGQDSDNEYLEELAKEGLIEAYIYDANETFLPDFTPDWLYDILEEVAQSSGGTYDESMESVFEIDNTFYNALIKHPSCQEYGEINTNNEF